MAWLTSVLKTLPFANSAMLLWGLAASLPIIIHLWSRRRYREVTWAAMEFLLAAVRKNARRIRVEQLLLLLIRVAILILLSVALADPILALFPTLGASFGTGTRTHFVLVIDGSYSMDYRAGDKSRFELAKDLATQVVEDSRQGDGFTLVLMAEPPQATISDPAFDPRDVVEEIASLRLRHGGANLPQTLAEVERILQQSEPQHRRLTETKVCFFTDLGRTTWDDAATEDCRQRVGRLAEGAGLLLFDVGQADVQNMAISALHVRDALATVNRGITLDAEMQNLGSRDQTAQRIVFLADGQQIHAEPVDVPAGGRATVSCTHVFATPGEHQIEVQGAEDPLSIDNHRWASIPVRESVEVLCIEGQPGAARYVAYALDPSPSAQPRVRPHVALENALLEQDLRRYDCIFLCNVGRFTPDESAVLFDYVRSGGGLVVMLGDQVQAASYNEQLGGERSGKRLLPARLEEPVAAGQYFFDPLQYRHAIVAPFAGHERSGLLTTPVWKYFRVTPYDKLAARVALAFQNRDPAIIEEAMQRGRVILLTTAASPESVDRTTTPPTPWTAAAAWPSFPPLVQEMLSAAVRRQGQSRNLLVGEPLEGSLYDATAPVPLDIQTPDGESERVQMSSKDGRGDWVYGATTLSGIYTANFGEPRNEVQRFAVNVNTRESNLERFDPELLPAQFQQDFQIDQRAATLPVVKPTQYFRYVLGLVLLLLLVETCLAGRFGRASA